MNYVPSVVIGHTERGKRIVNELISLLPETFGNLNFITTACDNNFIEKIQKIRASSKDDIQFAETPLCNLILVFPNDTKVITEIENLVRGSNQVIRKVVIHDELKKSFCNWGTYVVFSDTTDKNEKYNEEEIDKLIISYLLILLCSKIYDNADYNQDFFTDKPLSIGIKTTLQDIYLIDKYLRMKLISYVGEILLKKCDLDKNLRELFKNWLNGRIELKEFCNEKQLESNLGVLLEQFDTRLPFFTTQKWREDKIKNTYFPLAIKTIENYLKRKKGKAKAYREEIEKKVFDKLQWKHEDLYDFLIEKKVNTLRGLKSALSQIIEDNGFIMTLANEKNKKVRWETLLNYLNLNFNIKSPHPSWIVIIILLIIFLIPSITRITYTSLSLSLYIKWLAISALPLLGYVIFSIWSLRSDENKMHKQWLEKMDQISKFFQTAFMSLPVFYEHAHLHKLRHMLKIEYINFCKWFDEIEGIFSQNKTDIESVSNRLDRGLKEELDDFVKNNFASYLDVKDIIKSYLNNNTQDALNKLARKFIDDKFLPAMERVTNKIYTSDQVNKMVKNWEEKELPIFSRIPFSSESRKRKIFCDPDCFNDKLPKIGPSIEKIDICYPGFLGIMELVDLKIGGSNFDE